MSVREFIKDNYKHFNAGILAECSESLVNFLENKGRLIVTLAGAMSTAEIGRTLAPAIRSQRIHAICCTGANLEEDLFKLIANSSYEKITNLIDAVINDGSKDYDLDYIRSHVEKLTS